MTTMSDNAVNPAMITLARESQGLTQTQLAEMLNSLTPGDFPKKTLFSNSGSEAVENAVNMAKYFTQRPAVIAFEGAYHGRTTLTMSLTSKYNLFKK